MTTSLRSKSDRDRLRQRAGDARRLDKSVADTARKIVREYLEQGRPAQACMSDLVRAARSETIRRLGDG